jgi:starch phosphorylase
MSQYIGTDQHTIQKSIVGHVEYTLAKTRFNFEKLHAYAATAHSIKDRLIEQFNDTASYQVANDSKRVYYLSLEFLLGRVMQNALVNLDLEKQYKDALMDIGYSLEDLYEEEVDPALGNGGLGRLAACFLDSLAALEIPSWGYGIRYDYGIFKQLIKDGHQIEIPDYWLANGNPWEIKREDVTYKVRFGGHINKFKDGETERANWDGGELVIAMAYDNPIPGYNSFNCNNLRLWKSKPCNEFDFNRFNEGQYSDSINERQRAEYITSVLYPNDSTEQGKELRLKQQYFFCSASLRDIIRRYKKTNAHKNFTNFHEKNQIQLNDTHPAISTIELLRILIDEEHLSYKDAWNVVQKTFAYTNHTVLPEALEKWSVDLLGKLLPRHMDLIYLVNYYFLEKIKSMYPGDGDKLGRMSLIEEGP